MNKKIVILIVAVILIAIFTLFMCFGKSNESTGKEANPSITIKQYNYSLEDSLIKSIEITNKEYIDTLEQIKKSVNLKDLPESNLAISNEIVIEYEDGTSIIIQPSVNEYCYYKSEKLNTLIYMPEGLLDVALKILE